MDEDTRLHDLQVAYERACEALVVERERTVSVTRTIDFMRQYGTLKMHSFAADKMMIAALKEERDTLLAENKALKTRHQKHVERLNRLLWDGETV